VVGLGVVGVGVGVGVGVAGGSSDCASADGETGQRARIAAERRAGRGRAQLRVGGRNWRGGGRLSFTCIAEGFAPELLVVRCGER
jgi:hypothetical protein